MFTKIKENFTAKPVDDSLSISQLDQLSTLAENRITQIATSENYVGKSRCFCDPSEPDLIYFLKTENPLIGSTLVHPLTRKPSAVLDITSQNGRVAASVIAFDTTVDFFTVKTTFDWTRYRSFSKLQVTNWNGVPLSLSVSDSTACLPHAIRPDSGDVFYHRESAKHYRVLSVTKAEACNVCTIEPVEVN